MIRGRILIAVLLSASAAFTFASTNQPIQVDGGLVVGVPGTDPSITTYKSIPFAAPPVTPP